MNDQDDDTEIQSALNVIEQYIKGNKIRQRNDILSLLP